MNLHMQNNITAIPAIPATSAIACEKLSAQLGEQTILRNIDVVIPRAAWTSIVGPNGAGKSTFLKAIAGLLMHQGQVFLLGTALLDMPRQLRAQQLSWLGQNERSGEDLRVWDVVMLGRLPHQSWLAPASAADHQAVEQALKKTQAWQWRTRSIGQLSGGERQRVLLARALAVGAEVLLMDEPLANLDPPHQADWMNLARELVAQGKTVVSVLHEIGFALHANHMLILDQGQIVYQGACHEAATHRALERVFDQRIAVHSLDSHWVVLPK
jgi:iron complex transport system ATP-binding protein